MVLVAIFAAGLIASGAVAGVGPLAAFSALSSAADETGTDSTSTDTTETTSTEPTDTGTTETTTSEEAPTSPSPPSGPPTVSSDKPDYAPGERVTLTGANWYSGETVHINVNDDVGQSWTRNVDVIANASGEITDQFNLPDWFVATYTVIANGAISGTVRTSFTDGNIRFATSGPTLTGIAWQRHNGTTCSNPLGGGNSGTGDLTSDPTATLQLGDNNNQSLQLTVPVTASSQSFANWTGDGSAVFTTSGLGNRTICVEGFSGPGIRTVTANYATPDTTPPVIASTISGTLGTNGWYTSNVSVSWSVTDPDSTITSQSGCGASNVTTDTAGTTFTCTATSSGGTSSQSVTIKRDATAPVITFSNRTPTANANGWNNTNVTVNWSCSDTMSGVVSASVSQVVSTEGASQSATETCMDNAGNTASNTQTGINIDQTAPTISDLGPTTSPNANGWYKTDVVNQFKASDSLSGLNTTCEAAFPDPVSGGRRQDKTTSGEGAAVKVSSSTCSDLAGNTASAIDSAAFMIDQTAPAASATPTPAANANGWNKTDVTVTFTGSDALSDIDFCAAPVVLSSEGAGQSANGTCTDKAGNESAPATASGINIDKTAPTASASAAPSANANGWNNTNVTVSFSGADGLSGIDFCDADEVLSSEGAGQSANGTCTDKAGNESAPATASGINIDKTAPTISDLGPTTSPNANGWYKTDVVNQFKASDSLSGLNTTCEAAFPDPVSGGRRQDKTTSGEGAAVKVSSSTCSDLAGNTASAIDSAAFMIDQTAPAASATPTPAANANGWNKTDVTVTFTGSDALSDIDFCAAPVVLSSEGAGQSANGTCTDKAGNESAPATASGINIDKTAPTVTWSGGPAPGSSHYFGSVPAAPTCAAVDALSGPDACVVTGYGTIVGSHTMTATATDKAGNTGIGQRSYTVLAWTLEGFFQPVDVGASVWNTVKGGSTVPLKFRVFAGPAELMDTAIVTVMKAAQLGCSTGSEDAIEELAPTGGTSLRYASQFIYNWQTPKQPGNCYRVTVGTADGSFLAANFKLK